MSCDSQSQPLQLRFSNVTLTSDGLANSNGIALQVGTPGQILALTPSTLFNNTIINNRARCGSDANISCIESIGGGYDPTSSSTFRSATSDSWNGSTEAELDAFLNLPSTYLNDVVTISDNEALPGFPLLLQPTNALFYSALGIGKNSTFISRLVEAGLAPSHSWSFFAGVYSNVRAGALIIGGYADRFYQGTLHTKNVTDSCEVCFEVTSMNYEQDGVTTNLLSNDTGSFTAVVDPFYPVIIGPDSMLYSFGNATNGTWSPDFGLHTYDPNSVPTGQITVTLGNGLSVTIPNNALFDPPAYDNGLLTSLRNGSTVYGTFSSWDSWSPGSAVPNAAIFGMPFAAMVYLIRDHERQTVSIASANQDAQISGDATAICSLGSESGGGGGSSHTGAIAGGVVGGVVGLALIMFLAWFFWRRKNRKAKTVPHSEAKVEDPFVSEAKTDFAKAEMPANGTAGQPQSATEKPPASSEPVQELHSSDARVEMPGAQSRPPTEMPGEGKVIRSELPA